MPGHGGFILLAAWVRWNKPPEDGCHITLFKSRATDDKFDIPEDYGWRPLVKSMDIVEVEGEHLTMFAAKHLGTLARELNRRL